MVQRVGGARRKTRHKMSKALRNKGKISLTAMLDTYKDGDKVLLAAEPAVQKGMFGRRFYGRIGVVSGNQGACYKINILEGRKKKVLIVHPVHLKRVK